MKCDVIAAGRGCHSSNKFITCAVLATKTTRFTVHSPTKCAHIKIKSGQVSDPESRDRERGQGGGTEDSARGRGVIENKHSTDIESPLPSQDACASILSTVKHAGTLPI
jgi:hypothetical protein